MLRRVCKTDFEPNSNEFFSIHAKCGVKEEKKEKDENEKVKLLNYCLKATRKKRAEK